MCCGGAPLKSAGSAGTLRIAFQRAFCFVFIESGSSELVEKT